MRRILWVLLFAIGSNAFARQSGNYPDPVTLTAAEDQKIMMDQLGIRKLRPGYNGNESAPNQIIKFPLAFSRAFFLLLNSSGVR